MGKLFNKALLFEPMNWLIIGVMATIWLLAFHSIMTAFQTMQGASRVKQVGPGTVAVASVAAMNSSGTPAGSGVNLSPYNDTLMSLFTDSNESYYPESDGSSSYT